MRTNCNRSRNSNMIIFTICLLFVCLGNIHSQINVPNPSIDLHLDIENVEYEFVEKRKADLQMDVEGWEDRFGNSDRAVKFFDKVQACVCRIII